MQRSKRASSRGRRRPRPCHRAGGCAGALRRGGRGRCRRGCAAHRRWARLASPTAYPLERGRLPDRPAQGRRHPSRRVRRSVAAWGRVRTIVTPDQHLLVRSTTDHSVWSATTRSPVLNAPSGASSTRGPQPAAGPGATRLPIFDAIGSTVMGVQGDARHRPSVRPGPVRGRPRSPGSWPVVW